MPDPILLPAAPPALRALPPAVAAGPLDRPVPYDLAAEHGLLGSLLLDRDAIIKIARVLQPGDFFLSRNGTIYAAIGDLYARREPPDLVTLQAELDRRGQLLAVGGLAYLAGLMARVPTAVHVEYYARVVVDRALRRALLTAGGTIAGLGYATDQPLDQVLGQAEARLLVVRQRATGLRADDQTLEQAQDAYLSALLDRLDGTAPAAATGPTTGLPRLDDLTGGMRPGKLWVVTGESGGGKSTAQLAFLLAAQAAGARCALFSLEMDDAELAERALAHAAGVDSALMRAGVVTDAEVQRLCDAHAARALLPPLRLRTGGGWSLPEIVAQTQAWQAEHGLDVVCVDYLGLVARAGTGTTVEELDDLANGLKRLATEQRLCVLTAAQLSRAATGQDARKWDNYLRGTGAIKQAADVVLAVAPQGDRPLTSTRPWPLTLSVSKQRGGPTGDVAALWWLAYSRIGEQDTYHTGG